MKETYEVILSKPFQMWGAEMGVNEFGLAIGNEAVFTRVKIKKDNAGLTGMDLLRLALERSKNPKEAIACIAQLLEAFGQDACGGYKNNDFFYHNSFIIADSTSAYILETAGKSWALKIIPTIGSISNGLQIGTDYDEIHLAEEKLNFPFHYLPKPKPFSFQGYFSDFLYTTAGKAKKRQNCSFGMMESQNGRFNVEKAMAILKTHDKDEEVFEPKNATTASLCMHATGYTNPSTTTGSMVAEIRNNIPSTVWLTGTSMPCLSVFIPFFLGTTTLKNFPQPGASPDNSLWWKAEIVHRWVCDDYQNRKKTISQDLFLLQADFLKKESELMKDRASLKTLETFSSECLQKVNYFYSRLIQKEGIRFSPA
ncbi:carcinine hydrolase/isopenicillin-N N-acyltransferase family protein [Cecembia calidifontis]|nr:carcinine hydrolase/isopenicillin-N N-acyltransferase family protein [Cecembia calidifontis]